MFGRHDMIARLAAGIGVIGALIAVVTLGVGQFGYAYMGVLGGLGLLFKNIGINNSMLMMVLPLLAIGIMILLAVLVLLTLGILTCRIFMFSSRGIIQTAEFLAPLTLSGVLFCGLLLLRAFPGDRQIPVEFSDSYFFYPISLLLVAITLKIQRNKAEPDRGTNALPRAAHD
jgi:hypothetical protein